MWETIQSQHTGRKCELVRSLTIMWWDSGRFPGSLEICERLTRTSSWAVRWQKHNRILSLLGTLGRPWSHYGLCFVRDEAKEGMSCSGHVKRLLDADRVVLEATDWAFVVPFPELPTPWFNLVHHNSLRKKLVSGFLNPKQFVSGVADEMRQPTVPRTFTISWC